MTTLSSAAERLAAFLEQFKTCGHQLEDGTPVHLAAAALLRRIPELEAERDQLRAELERVRVPDGWSIYKNCAGSIQAAMPNGDKWHFKQNHRPGETAWFAYRLLSALLPAAPTPPHADKKGQ